MKTKLAFTLAEVLITLGIIGIVAEMTIPTVLQNFQDKAIATGLKKTYSTLNQAYTMAVQENGTPDNWGIIFGNSPAMLNKMSPYLRISKDCIDGSQGCWPTNTYYKYLAPAQGNFGIIDMEITPKLRLNDGTLLYAAGYVADCSWSRGTSPALQHICGLYYVDVNGYKSPNVIGKDTFFFWLTKSGIFPAGSPQDDTITFDAYCKDSTSAFGLGCTAWVIYNENLDYLKCNTLGWGGATKCN